MELQHIQLEDYNIIVSDEEVNIGDWYLTRDFQTLYCTDKLLGLIYGENDYGRQPKGLKKILASTYLDYNLLEIDYNGFEKDFNIVDVEKLAKDYGYDHNNIVNNPTDKEIGFYRGFKQCQSLNEKKFSEEQMKQFGLWLGENYKKFKNKSIDVLFSEFLSIIQSKITNIEIEMEYDLDSFDSSRKVMRPKTSNNQIKITKILS